MGYCGLLCRTGCCTCTRVKGHGLQNAQSATTFLPFAVALGHSTAVALLQKRGLNIGDPAEAHERVQPSACSAGLHFLAESRLAWLRAAPNCRQQHRQQ